MAENKIESLKKNWQENILTPLVKRFGERKPKFTTSAEDMIVETVYTPATGRRW
jgi:methylmalonyl-CoA mutase N-terminal domain/subunit